MIFVVENNLWVIGMLYYRLILDLEIWKKGLVFGMVSVYVDGMDVLKVWEVVKEVVERVWRGDGLMLIECEMY